MNFLYILGGIALVLFGIWQGYKEIKIFSSGKQDPLGADIKLFGASIGAVMIGVYLIVNFI